MMRCSRRGTAATVIAVAALLIASGCGQSVANDGRAGEGADSSRLIFASVSSMQPANQQLSHQPILEMLKTETGREIHVYYATDYAAVITGLREGRIHIAALGPLSYVLAKQQGAQITLLAAQVIEKGQPPEYRSYGITQVGSPIKTLADFRGKKICFTDRHSASGNLYPAAALLAAGIDPERDITPIFTGSHDASVLAVASRQCDAGFAFDKFDRRLIEQRQIQPDKIVAIWKSEPIPGGSMVIANNLSPQLRRQLTTAIQQHANADYLRKHGFCQGECAIADRNTYGYAVAEDAFYDSVREVCRITQLKSACEYG